MNYIAKEIRRGILLLTLLVIFFIFSSIVSYGAVTSPTAKGYITEPGGVNLRSSYSTSSSIVNTIPEGTMFTVVREKFTSSSSSSLDTRWFYIKSSYGNGYVRADLMDVDFSPIKHITTSQLNIRKGAGDNFTIVETLNKGSTVSVRLKVISSGGEEWYKISYNNGSYYVYGEYLTRPKSVMNTDFEDEIAEFPSSYRSYLRDLHEEYPTWHFKAVEMPYTWADALDEQCSNYRANTIPSSFKAGYKAVDEGTYDFKNHTYIGLDGSGWVAASRKAVAYYMDPRNWLDEINVFMYESLLYDPSTQSEDMVKDILSATAIPSKYASSYMQGGEDYNISPVYLAAKSRIELGSSDYMVSGTKFTYNGKTYEGYYNAYNIGASDSASGDAAKKGLVYAASGSTYLRPWTTLDKAIRGGAKFIAEDFIGNNQHTLYYERFNVANGLNAIGTHQYMTNTFAPATQANITYWSYEESGMLDTPFTFEIPVYKSMPTSKASVPGSGSNNNFLDSLKVYDGSTSKTFVQSFDRFAQTYEVKYAVKSKDVTIKAVPNDENATVTVSGNRGLETGENKITIKVKAPSGLTRYYYVYVTKVETVEAPVVKAGNNANTGKPVLTWTEAENADEYKIYRSESKDGKYTLLNTIIGCRFTNSSAETGRKYYYKVIAIGKTNVKGEATSEIVSRVCDLPAPVVTAGNDSASGKVKLTWKPVSGAIKYEVYRATSADGTYVKKNTQTGTTYVNTASAEPGKKYYYKVRAIHENSSAISAFSGIASGICLMAK